MDKINESCYNKENGDIMTTKRKKEIIEIVTKIREEFNVGATIPIDDIAIFCHKNYHCTVKLIPFSEKSNDKKYHTLDALARINPKTNNLEILVNQDNHNSMNKIRFTIAHELGHYILGHFKENPVLARGDSINLFDTRKEEEEANLFAAEILLPSVALDGEINIERVAKYYKVSKQVVQYRKANS